MSKKIAIGTIGLSAVTEDIRAVIISAADPLAIIQSITEVAPHNDRVWTFFGLDESVNYIFKIQKNVASVWEDIPGYNYTSTADDNSVIFKPPVQITADVTTGFVSGTNTFTFDGTGGKDDWRNYDIRINRPGVGPMRKGVDFSWNPATAVFVLLITGDKFAPSEWFDVEFVLQIGTTGGGQVNNGKVFSTTSVITANYTIQTTDFGNKLIVQGADEYLDLTLPDIATIPENKMLWIESSIGNHINFGLNTFTGTQKIDWLKGNLTKLISGRCESFGIFKQIKADTTQVWRIHNPSDGNWKTVGRDFHSNDGPADVINAVFANGGGDDGSGISSIGYARLYANVLNLNPSKVCSYADWPIGNNYLKFSLADPTTKKFHVPNTMNLFIRNTSATRDVAIFQDQSVQDHDHSINGNNGVPGIDTGINNGISGGGHDGGSGKIVKTDKSNIPGNETRPINASMNHFFIS